MKDFIFRALVFAFVNAILIGTFFLFNKGAAMPDYNIIYGTLVSLLVSVPYEIGSARKQDRRPSVETFGASIFGAIVMAAIIFVILLIAGVIN